ncbi:Triple gene block protein 2 [Asparagus virus 3]|uniref:Triple gene block protein 2 n=1 Tax=Asparagus virus 3 TaxID=445435 RepID=B1B3P0_9VIRU|nr:Triple gene block protein 2 [Asparagus virus 3]BAG12160.1 Triple gene block protein 2 [Asparagus virus 3]
MPGLTPPTNYESVFKILAIGALSCLSIYSLRTNHLPHTGDNIHHLPHGGNYADGTKRVQYFRPSAPVHGSSKFTAACAILFLTLLILAQSQWPARAVRCSVRVCGHCHPDSTMPSNSDR